MALSASEEALVSVSAALAVRREPLLREALERAARDADPAHVEEVLLQSHLFLGFPVALEALALWREVSGHDPPASTPDQDWIERGERVCGSVYGGAYEALRENVRRLHPDLERWMVSDGYGKVLGRPNPDLRVRELCIAATLVVMDASRQLYSHLRGALNVGASADELERVLALALPLASVQAAGRARDTWAAVRRRAARAGRA